MLVNIFNAVYILVVLAMIGLILMQQGSGANAGAGFGGGASATVFGARGSTSFVSKATWILASLFFVMSLGMGVYITRKNDISPVEDLGVMGAAALKTPANKIDSAKVEVAPTVALPKSDVPVVAPVTDPGKSD